jgi:hypothetical protein
VDRRDAEEQTDVFGVNLKTDKDKKGKRRVG